MVDKKKRKLYIYTHRCKYTGPIRHQLYGIYMHLQSIIFRDLEAVRGFSYRRKRYWHTFIIQFVRVYVYVQNRFHTITFYLYASFYFFFFFFFCSIPNLIYTNARYVSICYDIIPTNDVYIIKKRLKKFYYFFEWCSIVICIITIQKVYTIKW